MNIGRNLVNKLKFQTFSYPSFIEAKRLKENTFIVEILHAIRLYLLNCFIIVKWRCA